MRIIIIVVLAIIFSSSNLQSETENYEVISDGVGTTLETAIRSAQRNAVEQSLGVYIKSESEIKNYMTENDQIFSKSMGQIKSYEILEKKKESDGSWNVKIKAFVPNFDFIFSKKAKNALMYSAVAPGAGQMFKGKSLRGSLFFTGEAGLIVGALIANNNVSDAANDRDNPENIANWNFYNDKTNKWKNIRLGFYIGAVIVHVYNMYDAYTVLPENINISAMPIIEEDKLGMSISWKF